MVNEWACTIYKWTTVDFWIRWQILAFGDIEIFVTRPVFAGMLHLHQHTIDLIQLCIHTTPFWPFTKIQMEEVAAAVVIIFFGQIGRHSHVIHSCRYSATATSHSLIRDEVMRFSKFKTVAVFAILKLWRYTLVKISFEYMCRFFSQMVSITPHFWWFWEFYPQSIVGHLACFEPLCIKIHGLSLQAMKE